MPHCIVEYSRELEASLAPSRLLNAVYSGALNSDLFGAIDIKSRAMAFDHYQTGAAKAGFVHVTVKILSGRDQSQRAALAQAVLVELEGLDLSAVSLTVDIVEMEKLSYAKVLL